MSNIFDKEYQEQVQNTKWQIPKWHSGKYPIDIIDLTAVTSQ